MNWCGVAAIRTAFSSLTPVVLDMRAFISDSVSIIADMRSASDQPSYSSMSAAGRWRL